MTAWRRAAALAAAALALAGCEAPQYESNWPRLKVGMTRPEVEGLLGRPSSVHAPRKPTPKPGDTVAPAPQGERWQYGDTLSSFATGAVFPDEADERAWCVFFSPDGKVIAFRAAGWTQQGR